MVVLTSTYPLLPGQMPVIRTDFYLTGPLVVFLIVMTVLGGVYICGILVYMLINRSSTRCSLPRVKGGALIGVWDSGASTPLKEGEAEQRRKGHARKWIVRDHVGQTQRSQGPEANQKKGSITVSHISKITVGFHPVTSLHPSCFVLQCRY